MKLPPVKTIKGRVVVLESEPPSAIRTKLPMGLIVAPLEESRGPDKLTVPGTEPPVAKPVTWRKLVFEFMLPPDTEISGADVRTPTR
jgi:hypothetical protein